jgi:hypothetical protein
MGLEVLALAATAVGGVVSAAGAMQQGAAAKQAADYQAAVARNNQIIASQNAVQTRQAGEIEAQTASMRSAQAIGAAKAKAAASGLDVNQGSPVDVRDSAAQIGMLDALTIRNNALVKATGQENQSNAYGAEATLDTMKGRNAESAGQIGAFTSILGSASSFGSKWMDFQKVGAI